MKRFLKWSGIVAFAALLPLLMAPTGGIPSILTLQKLTVTAPTGKVCPSGANTGTVCVANNSSTGHVSWSQVVETRGAAGNQLGMLVASTAAGNNTDSVFRISVNGGINFNVDGAGTFTGIPNTAYGVLNINGATCTSVTAPTRGISGACTHTGTGTYQITFSPVFVAAPLCVATVTGSLFFVTMSTVAGTALVTTFNTSFAVADSTGAVQIFCALG